MNESMEEPISAYLDDCLSEAGRRELETWLRSDPANARQFAEAVMLHDRLRGEMQAWAESPGVHPVGVSEPETIPFPGTRPAWPGFLMRVAAMVAIVFAVFHWPSEPPQPVAVSRLEPSGFAMVAHAEGGVFEGGAGLDTGRRLGAGNIKLQSGVIRLRFDTGVEVTLQGPAEYALISEKRTRLSSGLLTANVPPGAEGFRVDTPTAEVIDLGTSFGVELDEEGGSRVTVFEGEVSVAETGSDIRQLVKEGEALRIGHGRRMETVEFDPAAFEKLWPVFSGIERSTGTVRLIPHWRRLRFVRSDDHVFIRQEGNVRRLRLPLAVNVTKPGRYETADTLTPGHLPVGRVVRSFLLHYQPETALPPGEVRRLQGSITFDRSVLGLIVRHEELNASASRFSAQPAGEQHPNRELNLTGRLAGDRVELSPDRKTLRLDLASPLFSSDLLRVIVEAGPPGRRP